MAVSFTLSMIRRRINFPPVAEGCIFQGNAFESCAVDGRKHQAHEKADANEAAKPDFAHDQYGAKRTQGSENSKNGEQTATVDMYQDNLF